MLQAQVDTNPVSSRPGADAAPQTRIRELDGWRAISVLLVILHHVFSIQYPDAVQHFYLPWHILGLAGFLGVDTFFVISGFVICRLLIMEESRLGSVSLKGFYYRRVFRILPPLFVYLGFLTLMIATGLIQERWTSLAIAASFLYDLNFLPSSWFLGHTWSLAVEEQFYLLFPTIWVLCRRAWRGLVFALAFFACVAWNVSLVLFHDQNPVVDARTRAGFACICFGVLMAIYEPRVRSIARRVPGFVVLIVALVLLVHPVPSGAVLGALYSAMIMPPAIGLVLMYSVENRGRFSAFLCSRPVQAVGLTSYGIYLWQQPLTGPISLYSRLPVAPPVLLPLLCVVVPLSYFFVEKPAMRLGKRLSRGVRK